MTKSDPTVPTLTQLEQLWFTRCPVPTSIGIAADLGWFEREFGADGIVVRSLQDLGEDVPREDHFAHGLAGLIREGGSVPALWARSGGANTRLLGLTWIEERQVVVTRPGAGIRTPADLVGLRIAAPRRPIAIDFWRAMALAGFHGALAGAGRTLDDVRQVDVSAAPDAPQWAAELAALKAGDVDAVYLKGAVAVEAAARFGAEVAIELDLLADATARINNGTPRPITVHQDLLDRHFDVVARFLAVLLEAVRWAGDHPEERLRILAAETGASTAGAADAYTLSGTPALGFDLSAQRLGRLARHEEFLAAQGFLQGRVDVFAWAAPEPLAAAHDLVTRRAAAGSTPA